MNKREELREELRRGQEIAKIKFHNQVKRELILGLILLSIILIYLKIKGMI